MTITDTPVKPLGRAAYGHIGHLPGSRVGPGDHTVNEGQAALCTVKARRDKVARIIVQEKLDGSCVAVAKIDRHIHALTRKGYPAASSPYQQHHLFGDWVAENATRFDRVLCDGERLVGEWMAQAHGTRYDLPHEPLVVFDIMAGDLRATFDEFRERIRGCGFVTPGLIYQGADAFSVEDAMRELGEHGYHGAIDRPEGAVWRVESMRQREPYVNYLAKWVRPEKIDGRYLPELSGSEPVWNWNPEVPA